MKFVKKFFPLFLFLLFFSFESSARIYILIDELSDKKFPIAVPSFVKENGRSAGGTARKLADLIRKDLRLAGLFQVLDDSRLPHKDEDVKKINFKKWKAIDVQALVKGVEVKGDSGKTIEIRLYDARAGEMLMGKRYVINGKNYIDAAHRFVDSLMKALTGVRGPFESRIAASCGKSFKHKILTFEMDGERRGGMGSGKHNISPAWSPDGKRLAYTSFTSKFPEVYVTSGRGSQRVTNYLSTTITPVWSPDGNSLIVASAKSGDTELYKVNLRGRILKRLTRVPNIDFNASVSPDGRMVFASERAGNLHLFSGTVNGGGAVRLTFVGYQNDQPDWSPDGSKIVFTSRDKGAFDIFVMDSDGSNILRLTRDEGNNESPAWSPDSRYIVYASSMNGLMIMKEDGTNQFTIPKSGGCVNPDWGPWLSKDE